MLVPTQGHSKGFLQPTPRLCRTPADDGPPHLAAGVPLPHTVFLLSAPPGSQVSATLSVHRPHSRAVPGMLPLTEWTEGQRRRVPGAARVMPDGKVPGLGPPGPSPGCVVCLQDVLTRSELPTRECLTSLLWMTDGVREPPRGPRPPSPQPSGTRGRAGETRGQRSRSSSQRDFSSRAPCPCLSFAWNSAAAGAGPFCLRGRVSLRRSGTRFSVLPAHSGPGGSEGAAGERPGPSAAACSGNPTFLTGKAQKHLIMCRAPKLKSCGLCPLPLTSRLLCGDKQEDGAGQGRGVTRPSCKGDERGPWDGGGPCPRPADPPGWGWGCGWGRCVHSGELPGWQEGPRGRWTVRVRFPRTSKRDTQGSSPLAGPPPPGAARKLLASARAEGGPWKPCASPGQRTRPPESPAPWKRSGHCGVGGGAP